MQAGDSCSTDNDGWTNLWQLAGALAPRTRLIAAQWRVNPHETRAYRAERELVTSDPQVRGAWWDLLAKDPDNAAVALWALHPRYLARLDAVMELRVMRRRHLVRHLRLRLSRLVRGELLNRPYEVRAKAPDGRDVSLTPRDLAGLDVEVWTQILSGDDTVYSDLWVRPRRADEEEKASEPDPQANAAAIHTVIDKIIWSPESSTSDCPRKEVSTHDQQRGTSEYHTTT